MIYLFPVYNSCDDGGRDSFGNVGLLFSINAANRQCELDQACHFAYINAFRNVTSSMRGVSNVMTCRMNEPS
jgi:hypothetical protein